MIEVFTIYFVKLSQNNANLDTYQYSMTCIEKNNNFDFVVTLCQIFHSIDLSLRREAEAD